MGRTATTEEMIAAATRLREIWIALRTEFGLGRVELAYDPTILGRGAAGCYDYDEKRITLGCVLDAARATKTLLHEARHAIQDARGELRGRVESWRGLWRVEHDAETFALREYAARFEARFGPLPPYRRWEHKRALRRAFEAEKAAGRAY